MINNKELIDRVYKMIGDVLVGEYTQEEWHLNTKLAELGFNSMNFVKLGVILEDEFDITLSVAELDFTSNYFLSIESLVCFIEEKLSQTKAKTTR